MVEKLTPNTNPEDTKKVITQYLKNGNLPEDKKEARKIKMRSARYTLSGDTLYKRGYTLPLLKCLSKTEGEYVLREIHEGICGSHMGSRMLAHKAVRAGYYWPKMNGDSAALVRHCDKCQRFARYVGFHYTVAHGHGTVGIESAAAVGVDTDAAHTVGSVVRQPYKVVPLLT